VSVTAPQGFRASGVTAGLKPSGDPDVALVVNDGPLDAAAAVFTTNRVVAAAVPWTRQAVADGRLRLVVLNSGGANAFTGPQGFADVHTTAEHAARLAGVSAADVAVCQTGMIGVQLPMPLLLDGIGAATAALRDDGGPDAARAIMTTDTVPKQAIRRGDGWVVGGMGKGAAMLAPALATMLVVLTTDAEADPATLDRVLRAAARMTFDRVDVDGCISTNDTVLLLASGASGKRPDEAALAQAVHDVCADLADQMVADAEGASKRVRVEAVGAASESDALEVARAVARSALVKCALAGSDPNWGRVAAAVGTTVAKFDPNHLDIAMNGVWVCRDSGPAADPATADLSGRDVVVTIDLRVGEAVGWVWTTDLTEAYVHENSAYST
jgi:glutamate N-acetyltransferase/amino-acid N-acetyltransferase